MDNMQKENYKAEFNLNVKNYLSLDIPSSFTVYGSSQEDVANKVIEKLKNAKILDTTDNTMRFGSGQDAKDSIIEYWEDLCNTAILDLQEGEEYIFLGNDEELTVEISEN